MNNQERISFLLNRYINSNCTVEELKELLQLLNRPGHEDFLTKELKLLWENTSPEKHHSNEQWEQLYMAAMIKTENLSSIKPTKKRLLVPLAAAAILIMTLFTALFFYFQNPEKDRVKDRQKTLTTELKPGSNKAILTLANGIKVNLDDAVEGKVSAQAGVQITKTNDGKLIYQPGKADPAAFSKLNSIETPKGGQYQITLSDGTKVWLNANSALKYPVSFGKTERLVTLTGEAYFEVAKNKSIPFRIITGSQVVEVLGTHFNINGYNDEPDVKTTLIEGAVKVSDQEKLTATILKPGEQSSFRNNRFQIRSVDTEAAVAWKNGYFTFNKSTLESIMRQLERWYDVDVVYQDKGVKTQVFSGNVSRFENASQVFSILELTGLVHFKIEGRRITAML